MSRTILLLALFLAACNNNSSTSSSGKNNGPYTWTKEDDQEFLSDCVDKAKGALGDDTAYIKCNCVLRQLKEKFPNLDSASNSLQDSAQAAQYIENCH